MSEARQRLLDNRKTQQRYDVRDDNFAYAVTFFEPPTCEERVRVYRQSESLDQWILYNFNNTNH